jgi:hypothetical protein
VRLMTEHQFVAKPCLDCGVTVTFPAPGDATCPTCGLPMYLSEDGWVGRRPREDWEPGRLQRKRPSASK